MPRRIMISLLLFVLLGVVCVILGGCLSGSPDVTGLSWTSPQLSPGVTPTPSPTPLPAPASAASKVQAFYQGDPNAGWDSRQQFTLWWDSACAPAALTMDLRAWGVQVHIGQVLDRLIALHAITPQNGLLSASALGTVAKGFGLQGRTFRNWTLEDVSQVTKQGVPVLIDVVDARRQTPYPAFAVGHWLVVTAVSSDQVQVSDSSGYHIHRLSLALFHTLFTGTSVVVWQGAAISLP